MNVTRTNSLACIGSMLLLLLASCAGQHVRQGDQAYAMMAYAKAGKHYEKAMSGTVDRGVLLRAADAARRQNEVDRAASLYEQAARISPLAGFDAYRYGQVLMAVGEWQQAREVFMVILEEQPEERLALDLFASCEGYKAFTADSGRFSVSPVHIEGVTSAFAAVVRGNGLVFTGEREGARMRSNPWNGRSFLDIYSAERKGMVFWSTAQPLKGKVNGPYHEGPMAFSADGRTMYFTRSNYYTRKLFKDAADVSHLKLFRATLGADGEWGDIREFAYNSEEWSVGHPALSADGRVLYFVSDMPGGSGGTDLWQCVDNGQGWERPQNLGPSLNTPGNEMFPTVNGDALYFASTGHENMGGLDIFETHRQGGRWAEPKNMLYPINTPNDDFSFVLDSTGTSGFLSSDRTGVDRIHSFRMNEPEFVLVGEVKDAVTGEYLREAHIQLVPLDGEEVVLGMTGVDGRFELKLSPNKQYDLHVAGRGMMATTERISTVGLTRGGMIREELVLQPYEVGKSIKLENIYYDYDKWDIRGDAARELDKMVRMIKDNPELIFELSSHTDSRGADMYNLLLSDARANSAVNYLIQSGGDPDRIRAMGYGEERLINGCSNGKKCTEEEHQANRRTEFKVIAVINNMVEGQQ